jgi:uncharacterized protein (TIGR01777 family)
MHIVISGSTGLIGSAFVASATADGHTLTRLIRRPADASDAVRWDPAEGVVPDAALASVDAVVHLAGENVAGRWTSQKRAAIRLSRVAGTRALCESLARLSTPPRVLVSASAIGYYGDRGDERLTEACGPGRGFLAEVAQEWEAATAPAADAGIRVVRLRFGVVLSALGGALQKMLPVFRMGMGGRIGHGRQYMSWIAIDDAVAVIHRALRDDALTGPVNVTTPNPVTNAAFVKILGRVLGRPTALPVPAFAIRAALGEMADEMLLASVRAEPRHLLSVGYAFAFPDLEPALRHVLSSVTA